MKILFLTRSYPPSVGGMEIFNYNLFSNFKSFNKNSFLIANTHGKKFIPFFIFFSFFRAIFLIKKRKITHLHIGDSFLSPVGYIIKLICRVNTSINVYGLDITFKNRIYQKVIPFFVKKMDLVVCISKATKNECVVRGINSKKCIIIPCGINPNEFIVSNQKNVRKNILKYLSKKFSTPLYDKKIILTVGRLVKRKGHGWFIQNVMPSLPIKYVYLIAGDGPEKDSISRKISKLNLGSRVYLLGKISDKFKKNLYNSADLFVMPNISIEGDMEGFGIVSIEAGSVGLPTVASNIEGIKDAVLSGKTGWLVEEKNVKKFLDKISNVNLRKDTVRQETVKYFSWEKIASKYKSTFLKL